MRCGGTAGAAGRAERVPEREGGAEAVFRVPQGRGTSRLESYKIRLLGQDRLLSFVSSSDISSCALR